MGPVAPYLFREEPAMSTRHVQRRSRSVIGWAVGLVLAISSLVVATPASADVGPVSDVVTTAGGVILAPGVPTTGCVEQTVVNYAGNLIDAGDDTVIGHLNFAGASNGCETLIAGSGAGRLDGAIVGPVDYARTGTTLTITGAGAINGEQHVIVFAVCSLVPTSVNPVTTLQMACSAVLSS
jgi:hypothetical protein